MVDATSSTTATSTASTSAQAAAKSGVISSDFNTFLNLLTAQLKNQDPTQPMDSNQFSEQVASFSAVEQQALTNTKLDHMIASLNELSLSVASDYVGEDVGIKTGYTSFDGRPIRFEISPPEGADTSAAAIQDLNGNVIKTLILNTDNTQYEWHGDTNAGDTISNGIYQITIHHFKDGVLTHTQEPEIISTVRTATVDQGKIQLGLENDQQVAASDVNKK